MVPPVKATLATTSALESGAPASKPRTQRDDVQIHTKYSPDGQGDRYQSHRSIPIQNMIEVEGVCALTSSPKAADNPSSSESLSLTILALPLFLQQFQSFPTVAREEIIFIAYNQKNKQTNKRFSSKIMKNYSFKILN